MNYTTLSFFRLQALPTAKRLSGYITGNYFSARPLEFVKKIGALAAAMAIGVITARAQANDSAGIGNRIVYVQYQAENLSRTKAFFEHAFGWNFAEQSPTNFTFFDGRISGAFTKAAKCDKRASGGALVSIYSDDIDETRRRVIANGGKIVEDIVSTAECRRFIFEEPSGNEFAVVASK
jgi:uncharacterized protein